MTGTPTMTANSDAASRLAFDHWIAAALELVRNDEVERALKLLDLVPAFHRDNPIPELEQLKKEIRAALITPHAYLTSGLDSDVSVEKAVATIQGLLRGRVLLRELKARSGTPHIVDMGPGEYWVALGLKELGFEFTYHELAFDQNAATAFEMLVPAISREKKKGAQTIFLCHEVIEHLPSTDDITIEALRHCGGWPDFVHLSTPYYCYDPTHTRDQWNKPCGLPHLRGYTPREFIAEANRLFPGYNWEYCTDAIQSLRGYKTGGSILGESNA